MHARLSISLYSVEHKARQQTKASAQIPRSTEYDGKAVRLGAGILSLDATTEAHKHGLVIVGGNCPSVGLAGGYTQGDGIRPLASRYRFGADQVLEWRVVTVAGEVVEATPEKNSDLYWALSGGGGGTYGVVVSMTVKAYPEECAAAANLTLSASGTTQDRFYEAVGMFHEALPLLSAAGRTSIYVVQSTVFALTPAMLSGDTKEQLDAIFGKMVGRLQALNISYQYTSTAFASCYDAYQSMVPPTETAYFQIGSRVLPAQTLTTQTNQLVETIREVNGYGTGVGGLSYQVPKSAQNSAADAVNTRLRSGSISMTLGTIWNNTDWSLNVANRALISDVLIFAVDRLTPDGSTAYLNEGDFREPQWQKAFFMDQATISCSA